MTATDTGEDRAHMARAIAVAERARGLSSPNPAVGCVLVRDGRVVTEAATAPAGGPHAEARVLTLAGDAARGATAYVTLEPCAHHGRTPPCADALAEAGLVRVVFGLADPNPLARDGAAVLRAAGVRVDGGVLAPWVAEQLEGFRRAVAAGRPQVTLKLAHTVDGRTAPPVDADEGAPAGGWVTGMRARRAVHRWRAGVDGVLVGSGTVLADDPRLDVRHVPAPGGQPRAIVLDTRLRTPLDAEVVRPGTLLLTGAEPDPAASRALGDAGVVVETVPCGPDGHLDLEVALSRLVAHGVTSVLAEPGVTLARALVRAGLVDRLVCHVALDLGAGPLRLPVPLGCEGATAEPPGASPALRLRRMAAGWRLERLGGAGGDLVLQLRTVRTDATDAAEVGMTGVSAGGRDTRAGRSETTEES